MGTGGQGEDKGRGTRLREPQPPGTGDDLFARKSYISRSDTGKWGMGDKERKCEELRAGGKDLTSVV